MAYPSTIDSFTTKTNGQVIDASDVNNPQTAIVALETKVGVNSSAVTTSLDYKVTNSASVNPGHTHTASSLLNAVSIYSASGTTLALTTTANQKVIVWAKGSITSDASDHTVLLNYNAVQKDIVNASATNTRQAAFALQYTETPGAGTQNITVTSSQALSNVVIIALVT